MEENRREPREPVQVHGASIREQSGSWAAAIVYDLSIHGFKAEWLYRLHPGDRICAKLPEMEGRPAKVISTDDLVIGCELESPLHPAVFDRILRTGQSD